MLDMDSIYKEHAEFVYKYLLSLCHEEDTGCTLNYGLQVPNEKIPRRN